MQKGTKDKIILHEAGEKTCKIPVRLKNTLMALIFADTNIREFREFLLISRN